MISPSVAEIAARVTLGSDDATAVIVDPSHVDAVGRDLLDELVYTAEDEGRSAVALSARSAERLMSALLALPPDTAAVVTDLESLPDSDLVTLDRQRNRLLGGPDVVVLTTPEGAARLAHLAPNL